MSIFETASRQAFRYQSNKGLLTTEQLWDLPLQAPNGFDLDTVARELSRQLKAVTEESFVSTKTSPAKTSFELQMEIVKHVIAVKLQEAEDRRLAVSRKAEREKLLGILADKQDASLLELTKEQLEARIAGLS